MAKALDDKDYAAAIKNAGTVLASNYADMDAPFAEYVAHKELKESEAIELHEFVLPGVRDSIMDSGDGKDRGYGLCGHRRL